MSKMLKSTENLKYFDKVFTNFGYSFLFYLQIRIQKTITFKGTGISVCAISQGFIALQLRS